MKTIKSMVLCFENAERMIFTGKHVSRLMMVNEREYEGYTVVSQLSFEIARTGNVSKAMDFTYPGSEEKPFDRICKKPNLVAIHLLYEDGEDGEYVIKWDKSCEFENTRESSYIDALTGALVVDIL